MFGVGPALTSAVRKVADAPPEGHRATARDAAQRFLIDPVEVPLQDSRHAECALWQLTTDAETLAPPWLRTVLGNHAAALATTYGMST